ncbi:MAG: LysM peptidoglycan-binding domain-containing protein [Sphingobacteriales bacterium]|nr:MAG: LysM peptidoglycan-binding domain-containing protein [Sphingobacteriales bacterium]
MKKFYTLILLAFTVLQLQAQQLMVQQEAGKLYVPHTVQPKENWYSVGRMFNLSPSVIAGFNGLKMDKGLSIGQKIKIPLNDQNLAQGGQPAADEAFIPVFHTVKEKEGLYRIGQTFNKVSADQLKAFNKMKTDDVVIGSNLVVGYLKVKKELSPLAGAAVLPPATVASKPATTTEAPKATTSPAATPKPVNPPPVVIKEPEKKEPVAKPVEDKPAPVTKPAEEKPVVPPPTIVRNDAPSTEGAFAAVYKDQSKGDNQTTGLAGIFKSTSGWKDGKYYVLMNKVSPGTIVKITSVSTNRVVYAKVLGEIPPGKENDGLLIRISNAASAQLQVAEGSKFDVSLVY